MLPVDRWRWLHKSHRDYLLADRSHQSTYSRFEDMSEKGWSLVEGGQLLMREALERLEKVKKMHWELLAQGIHGTPLAEWADVVHGLSSSQVAFLSGTYATCFIPTEAHPDPMGVPSVRSAWGYHGLHVTENGKAPSYTRGESAGFDRDIKAKIIHRVGGIVYRQDNYYRGRYLAYRERKALDPDWQDEPKAHHHAAGLRYVTKEIIKDWWRVLHGQEAHAVLAGSEVVA